MTTKHGWSPLTDLAAVTRLYDSLAAPEGRVFVQLVPGTVHTR
jgi:hypothetical protein